MFFRRRGISGLGITDGRDRQCTEVNEFGAKDNAAFDATGDSSGWTFGNRAFERVEDARCVTGVLM